MGPDLSGTHVFSSMVLASRLGHGTGGKDRYTYRSLKLTAVVSLGV